MIKQIIFIKRIWKWYLEEKNAFPYGDIAECHPWFEEIT